MPAVKITNKPVSTPGDQTHFLVTQPELPEGYTPTGQETEEELAELKVESVREIEIDDMVELIQDKLDMDVTPTTGSSKPVTSAGIKAALDSVDTEIGELKENLSDLQELTDTKAVAIYETASGEIASFSDGADDMPLKSCVVSFEPIQEGEGDPSPENVRPISGRTGLTVSHSGADTSDPATISVDWETEAGTVYGGTLDVVSGKLTVDKGIYTMTGSERWSAWQGIWYAAVLSKPSISRSDLINCISDKLVGKTRGSVTSSKSGVATYGVNIYLGDTEYNTLSEYTGTQIVYTLATPVEIQLTPQEVTTLLGENNIWSDSGDLEAEYPADTKTYIDTKIAEAVAAAMA